MGAYSISKAAVVAASDVMRRELEKYGVRVVCIEPGFLASPMLHTQVCMNHEELDYSQTLLKNGRGDEALNKSLATEEMAPPSLVASTILDALFCDPPPNPHLIVDLPGKKFIYELFCLLPYSWVDRVMDGYERRNKATTAKTPLPSKLNRND